MSKDLLGLGDNDIGEMDRERRAELENWLLDSNANSHNIKHRLEQDEP